MFHKLRLCKADILVHSGLITWCDEETKKSNYILGDVYRCDCKPEIRHVVKHWTDEEKAKWRRENARKERSK